MQSSVKLRGNFRHSGSLITAIIGSFPNVGYIMSNLVEMKVRLIITMYVELWFFKSPYLCNAL